MIDVFTRSTGRIFMITAIVAVLLPIALLLPNLLSNNSGSGVTKDHLDTHKLIANSLAEPIKLNIALHQASLNLLDNALQASPVAKDLLDNYANSRSDVISVSLLLSNSKSPIMGVTTSFIKSSYNKASKTMSKNTDIIPDYINQELKYQKYDSENSISPVFTSSFSNQPVILLKHYIFDESMNKRGTLFAEIGLNFLQRICSQMRVGSQGNCTVVDGDNNVLAHPNAAWVSQSHTLNNHPLIKALEQNGSGSTQYTSPADQREMLGGFANIEGLNWSILISRPKDEVDLPFTTIKNAVFTWLAIGVALSLLLATVVTFLLTKTLKSLNRKASLVDAKADSYKLGKSPKNSPKDVANIWNAFSKLLLNYQALTLENKSLKASSSTKRQGLIQNLREKNAQKPDNIDPLTGITNGTCFLAELHKSLSTHKGDDIAVILIEVDNYNTLKARKKEAIADAVLKHVAAIIEKNTRSFDMAARFGNKGHFAVHVNNCSTKSLQGTANKLKTTIENSPLLLGEESIYITLFIGVISRKIDDKLTVKSLMSEAGVALQQEKNANASTPHNKSIETA